MTLIILTEIWNWATWSCSLLGKATGCLLMTRLESAPGFTWGPRVPKCTALCAETLPPPPNTPYFSCVLWLWKARRLEGRGSGDWSESPARENEKKRKITSCWISDAPLFSRTLSLCSHLCSKWLNAPSWAPSLSPPTFCLPHSPKPVVFSTLRWHRHPFHLSNYIHFQTDVLWQSYKALMSLFLINEILP